MKMATKSMQLAPCSFSKLNEIIFESEVTSQNLRGSRVDCETIKS